MMNITVEQVKELEKRRDELTLEIVKLCEQIKEERDSLADVIHSTERELQHYSERIGQGTEEDIYKIENIMESGNKNDPEKLRKKIMLCYKAYSINPFRDGKKAKEMLMLLDELECVTKQLDCYYNEELYQAKVSLEKAKKKVARANERRLEYRRMILGITNKIKDAAAHGCISNNELRKHGADDLTSGILFGVANCSMNGTDIVDLCRHAIRNEQNEAKRNREVQKQGNAGQISNSTWVEGEAFAMFGKVSGVSKNAFANPLKGLFAK